MIELAEAFLPLEQWGFKLSERIVKPSIVIYDSEWCRVRFLWAGWDSYGGNTINVYYGRLHAPRDSFTTAWKGQLCHCWHREYEPLQFLDGLSPQEAVLSYGHIRVRDAYLESELGQRLSGSGQQPEWLVRMQAMIWEEYGQRFFELFDLRRPDLWESYVHFIKEFYAIKGLNQDIDPPQDQIC